jgi:hypothetical protein
VASTGAALFGFPKMLEKELSVAKLPAVAADVVWNPKLWEE